MWYTCEPWNFKGTRRTILTSGTITSQNLGSLKERYRYFMDSLGCPDDVCVSEPKKSPFDFDKHTMLSEKEKLRIREINEVTVTERYMTIREWEVNA